MRAPPAIEVQGSLAGTSVLPPPLPPPVPAQVLQNGAKVPPVIGSQPRSMGVGGVPPPVPAPVLQQEVAGGCLASAVGPLEQIRRQARSDSFRGQLCLGAMALLWVALPAVLVFTAKLFGSVEARQNALIVVLLVWTSLGVTALVICFRFFSRSSAANCRYRVEYKEKVFPAAIRLLNPTFQYQPHWGIPSQRFWESRLFLQRVERYWSQEYVQGVQGATAFEFANVWSGCDAVPLLYSEKEYRPVFHGLFFVADFNKHFTTSVLVLPTTDGQPGSMAGLLEKWGWKNGRVIHLEDPEFERQFTVYAEDEVEVRYLLTPALMQRILKIRARGRLVSLSFFREKLHVALEGAENVFLAPDPRDSAYSIAPIQTFLDQVRSVLVLIDTLNLNTRIWSKR